MMKMVSLINSMRSVRARCVVELLVDESRPQPLRIVGDLDAQSL